MKKKILIIDDDEKLNKLLTDYLDRFDFSVTTATHPDDGLRHIKKSPPDLVVLDVMLPGRDGFDVCKEIRKTGSLPIIMLTARGEVTDRVVGLELGADDYMPKPFEPRELVARIQSILRRSSATVKRDTFRSGGLEIDFNKCSVSIDGKSAELTHMEYEILVIFVNNRGILLERDKILDDINGLDWEPYNRSIDVLISRLRQKLGDNPKNPKYLKTVWGFGYIFIGEDDA